VVGATTTARPRYKLPYDEEDVFAAVGKLCVADIEGRGQKPNKRAIAPYCRKVAKWLTDDTVKPCLILAGNAGTGKTTLLRSVNRLFGTIEMYDKKFLSATSLAENFIVSPEESERHFCRGHWCKWLLLDDMGEEPTDVKEYGNVKSPVIRVIASRYERMLPMLITTNLKQEDILAKYGERTFDRLKEIAEWVSFSGESFRK